MAVINMYHHCGRVPFGSVNIMRGSEFGNPYRIGLHGGRAAVIEKYEAYLIKRVAADPEFAEKVRNLVGQDLCCCCKPEACHGDVLERVANELQEAYDAREVAELEVLFGPVVEEL